MLLSVAAPVHGFAPRATTRDHRPRLFRATKTFEGLRRLNNFGKFNIRKSGRLQPGEGRAAHGRMRAAGHDSSSRSNNAVTYKRRWLPGWLPSSHFPGRIAVPRPFLSHARRGWKGLRASLSLPMCSLPSHPFSRHPYPTSPRVPFVDYYEVLNLTVGEDSSAGVDPGPPSHAEVREAWRRLQKAVHPDRAGDYAAAAAALVNEAYEVLSSDTNRRAFDADRREWLAWGSSREGAMDRSLMDPVPLSKWSPPPAGGNMGRALDAAFVDESHCIGCLKCALLAPKTFFIETRFGCARVVDQWADGIDPVEDAIAACPVQCIHLVDRHQELALLERVAARQWHEGGSGGGAARRPGTGSHSSASPFDIAASLRRRAQSGGVAPWPSRSRTRHANTRSGAAGYTTADAAVHAAAAAAAAASEASAWRDATSISGGRHGDEGREGVFRNNAVVKARASAAVPVQEYIGGVEVDIDPYTGRSPASAAEVARVQSLLARGSGSFDSGDEGGYDWSTSAGYEAAMTRQQPEFWEPLPLSDRPGSDDTASFDLSDDDHGYAPTEWIQKLRMTRAGRRLAATRRTAASGKVAAGGTPGNGWGEPALAGQHQYQSVFSTVPPLAPVFVAAILAGASLGSALFGGEGSTDASVWSIHTSHVPVMVNGVQVEWLTGPWGLFGCRTVAWTFLIQLGMQVIDSVAFAATLGAGRGGGGNGLDP